MIKIKKIIILLKIYLIKKNNGAKEIKNNSEGPFKN